MYTTSNINITDTRCTFMNTKNDIFLLGCLHTLRALQSVKDDGGDMNDIQWDVLLENQRRNLEDPNIEECLDNAKDLDIEKEDWR